jgi:hypothetical protein
MTTNYCPAREASSNRGWVVVVVVVVEWFSLLVEQ